MPKRYYLETSVIRSRLIGLDVVRKPLVEKLRNQTILTSNFVKMEFNRGLICDVIEFYVALKDRNSIRDAVRWWSEEYKIRKHKNLQYIFADVFVDIQGDDVQQGLFKLREKIKVLLNNFNFLIQRFEKNGTACYFSNVLLDFELNKSPEEIENALIEFYQEFQNNHVKECQIIELFGQSRAQLGKLIASNSVQDGFEQQKDNLKKIEAGKLSFSCSTCGKIGDTVIALECPDYAILLSHDEAFENLCKNLGLKFEIIPSVRAALPAKNVLAKLKKKR